MLAGGIRDDQFLALQLLPKLEEAALLLEDIVERMAGADAEVADFAASTFAEIAARLTLDEVSRWEIAAEHVSGAVAAGEIAARNASLSPFTRISCLRALPSLYALTGGAPGPWTHGLLEDADPDIRLATLDLLAAFSSASHDAAIARKVHDPVVAVAAHAARTICDRAAIPDPILVPLTGRIKTMAREASLSRSTRLALRRCAGR